MRKRLAILAAALACAGPAAASTHSPVSLTCPIGGQRFDSQTMASNSYFGERPDGRPYSPSPITTVPECPENGFLIFDNEFTPAEIRALKETVDTAEYQDMRIFETVHYRVWWLQLHSGRRDPYREVALLHTATWESDHFPKRKARYQKAFAGHAMTLKRDDAHAPQWLFLNLRAVNALRELGRFDEAAAHLDTLDQPIGELPDADQRKRARRLADGLRDLIRAKNRASEPLAMVPRAVAVSLCIEGRVDTSERARCSASAMKSAMEKMKKGRAAG